ncbi:outer membrane secretion protein, partial [Rhodopirellula maiorica SM1]
MPLRAQEGVPFSDVLPPASEDEDDIELIDDWLENTVVLVGTPGDDKITIEVEDDQIRFWVNDESVGRIRERELPPIPREGDPEQMIPDPSSLLKIIVSGAGGNDCISLGADSSAMILFFRVRFLLYGGDGHDIITSEGVEHVTAIGGLGIDNLMGNGFQSEYIGSEMLITNFNDLNGVISPDGCKDHLFPGNFESTAYRKHFLHFTPVVYTNPSFKVLDKTPPKLPGVPSIVSREKGDLLTPEATTFDTILLEQDEVHNDVGCDV